MVKIYCVNLGMKPLKILPQIGAWRSIVVHRKGGQGLALVVLTFKSLRTPAIV